MDQPIVGVRFVEAGPVIYCSPGDLELGPQDYVVVRTDRGEQLGWVVVAPDQVISQTIEGPVRVVERLATAEDVEAHREQKRRAEEDTSRAQAIATRVDPRMRVASLTYNLAGDRAYLTYTSKDNGSDERLRRELSRTLEVEIDVEQVGERDRAKALGGIGQCGRALCCSTWMTEFPAISIKMAKDQGLAPNPSKISGVCGRLLCCLSFEVDAYRSILGTLPKVGKRVTTPVGRAKVLSINAIKETVRLRFDDGGAVVEMPAAQLRSQYGTAVRPEDLEAQVEAPVREQDRRRRDAFVAVLEPVSEPAVRQAPDGDATGSGDADRQGRRRRRRGDADAPEATGGASMGGVRIARRRSGRPSSNSSASANIAADDPMAPDSAAPGAPAGEARAASNPAPGETQGNDAGQERRGRRRGRRGGRRRRGGGDAPAEGAAE